MCSQGPEPDRCHGVPVGAVTNKAAFFADHSHLVPGSGVSLWMCCSEHPLIPRRCYHLWPSSQGCPEEGLLLHPFFPTGTGILLAICIAGCEGPLLLPLPKRLGQGLAPQGWFFPGSGVGAEAVGMR